MRSQRFPKCFAPQGWSTKGRTVSLHSDALPLFARDAIRKLQVLGP